jgi:hypothetical protein
VAVRGALKGTEVLLRQPRVSPPTLSHGTAARIVRALLTEMDVQALTQVDRMLFFQCVHAAFDHHVDVLRTLSEELCEGLVVAMDGEKDPRCLLLAFQIWAALPRVFEPAPAGGGDGGDVAVFNKRAEELAESVAVYFPISFTPPPNDTRGITRYVAGAPRPNPPSVIEGFQAVWSSTASPPHRLREGRLTHPGATSRPNLADALALLPCGFPNPNASTSSHREHLRAALRGALTASASFAPVTVPLALEKLEAAGTAPPQTRLDALDLLAACIDTFPLPAVEPHVAAIWCAPPLLTSVRETHRGNARGALSDGAPLNLARDGTASRR